MLGGLVGMAAADVAFVESAQAALVALLTGWRLPAGYPGGLPARRVRAQRRPVARLRAAPGAAAGRRHRPRGPRGRRAPARRRPAAGSCTSPTSPATAGCVQPAAEIAALCRAAGVPLVLDAAQSLGPRRHRPRRRRRLQHLAQVAGRPAGGRHALRPAGDGRPAHPGAARARGRRRRCGRSSPARRTWPAGSGWSSRSASTWRPAPTGCGQRLAALGRATRELLDGAGGWRVVEPVDEPTATTTLRPPDGVDVVATRARLLNDHGIVTTAIGRERAPGEMTGPRAAGLAARGRDARRPRGPRRRPLTASRQGPPRACERWEAGSFVATAR